ncbi:protein phosphatase regulator [Ceratocystis pirilliformis]|uniref:Protein phosphatase regulator n=1 Tax=Ceratocystis pirilliformis TaxID=259994 RepID=A0ABR3YLG8_9PEZI
MLQAHGNAAQAENYLGGGNQPTVSLVQQQQQQPNRPTRLRPQSLQAPSQNQNRRDPRISWSNGTTAASAVDLQQFADDLTSSISFDGTSSKTPSSTSETKDSRGRTMEQEDALAIAQNGGTVEYSDDESHDGADQDLDDDLMDRISSSPSIEDGLSYPPKYPLSPIRKRKAIHREQKHGYLSGQLCKTPLYPGFVRNVSPYPARIARPISSGSSCSIPDASAASRSVPQRVSSPLYSSSTSVDFLSQRNLLSTSMTSPSILFGTQNDGILFIDKGVPSTFSCTGTPSSIFSTEKFETSTINYATSRPTPHSSLQLSVHQSDFRSIDSQAGS